MDDLPARQKALLDYIQLYMMENAGRAPAIREMVKDKVGQHTSAGAITSTSVINYNLKKLQDAHRLRTGRYGTARNLKIPGATYGIPWNEVFSLDFDDYEVYVVDVDCHSHDGNQGMVHSGVREKIAAWVESGIKVVYTCSTIPKNLTNAWDAVEGDDNLHLRRKSPYQILVHITNMGWDPGEIAVVTNHYGLRLASLGFGTGLFDPYWVFQGIRFKDKYVIRGI